LVFAIAESDVTKDSSLHLLDFFFEYSEILQCNIEDICRVFVDFDRLSVRAFFEFKLRLFLSSLDLARNLVKLRLEPGLLLGVDSRLGTFYRGLSR